MKQRVKILVREKSRAIERATEKVGHSDRQRAKMKTGGRMNE